MDQTAVDELMWWCHFAGKSNAPIKNIESCNSSLCKLEAKIIKHKSMGLTIQEKVAIKICTKDSKQNLQCRLFECQEIQQQRFEPALNVHCQVVIKCVDLMKNQGFVTNNLQEF